MVRDQDAESAVAQLANHQLNVGHRDRIDAGERFVEQQEGRFGRDRARDLDPAALAARERVAARVDQLREAELVEQFREPALLFARRNA